MPSRGGATEFSDGSQAETAVVQNAGQRYAASIQLVKALGGGWTSPDAEAPQRTQETGSQDRD